MSKKIYSYDEIAQSINRISKQVREDALIQANPIGYMQQKQQELYKAGRIKEAQSMSPLIGQLKFKKYEEDKMKFLQEKKDFQENVIKKLDGYSTITGKTYETLLKNVSLLNPEDPNYKSKYDAGIRKIQDFEKDVKSTYDNLVKKKADTNYVEEIYNKGIFGNFSEAKGFWNSAWGAVKDVVNLPTIGAMHATNAVGNLFSGKNYGNGTGKDVFFDDYENINTKKLDKLNRQLGADTILKELQAEKKSLENSEEYLSQKTRLKDAEKRLKDPNSAYNLSNKATFGDSFDNKFMHGEQIEVNSAFNSPALIKMRNLDRSIEKLQKYKNGSSDVSWDESVVNPTLETFNVMQGADNLYQTVNAFTGDKVAQSDFALQDYVDNSGIQNDGHQFARGTVQSLKFMAEMAASGGFGSITEEALKGGSKLGLKALGKYGLKNGAKVVGKEFLNSIDDLGMKFMMNPRNMLKRGAIGLAKENAIALETALKMPSSYIKAGKEYSTVNNQIIEDIDENGENKLRFLQGALGKKQVKRESQMQIDNLNNRRDQLIEELQKTTDPIQSESLRNKLSVIDSKITQYENIIGQIGDIHEDISVARALAYGVVENTAEAFSERLGEHFDKIPGINKLNNAIKKGLGKIGGKRIARALGSGLDNVNDVLDGAVTNTVSDGITSNTMKSMLGNAVRRGIGKNRMISSVPSEMLEEVIVNTLYNPFAQDGTYKSKLEELKSLDFYKDVFLQILLINGGMSTVGAVKNPKHTFNMLFNKEYADEIDRQRLFHENLNDLYERMNNGEDIRGIEDLNMLASRGSWTHGDYHGAIVKAEKEGDHELANKLSKRYLENMLHTAILTGNPNLARETFRSIIHNNEDANGTFLPASLKNVAQEVWDKRSKYTELANKYGNRINFHDIYNAEIDKEQLTEARDLIEKQIQDNKEAFQNDMKILETNTGISNVNNFDITQDPNEFDNKGKKLNWYKKRKLIIQKALEANLESVNRMVELLGQKEALNGQLEQKEKEIQDLQNDKFNNIHLMNYVAQNVQTIDDLDELDSFERNIQHRYKDLVTKTGYQENGKDTYYDTKGYIQEAIENRRSELKGINITEHLENLPPANGDITDNPQGDVVKEDTITDPNLDPNINPNENPNIKDGDITDKDLDEVPEGNDTVFETSPELENEITDTITQKDNNNSNPVNLSENENPSNINDNEDNNKNEFDGPTAFAPKKKTSFAPRKSNFADLSNEQKEKFKSMVQNVLNSIKEQGKKVSFENFIKYIAQVNREQADLQYGLLKQSYEYTTGETINNEEFRDIYNKIFNPVTALLDMGSSVISDEEIDMANLENSEKAVNTPKIVKRSNPTPIVITETNIGDVTLFPNQPDFLAIDYEVNYDEETGEYKAVNKGNTVLRPTENMYVLNPDVIYEGVELEVKPIEEDEYDKTYVSVYTTQENGEVTRETMLFSEYAEKFLPKKGDEVDRNSQEFISKVPMFAHLPNGKRAFRIKDTQWYNNRNVKSDDPETKATLIAGHRKENFSLREQIVQGNNKIVITSRQQGYGFETKNGEEFLAKAYPGKPKIGFVTDINTIVVDGKKYTAQELGINVDNTLTTGATIHIYQSGHNENNYEYLNTNEVDTDKNPKDLEEQISDNISFAIGAVLFKKINNIIAQDESKKALFQPVLNMLKEKISITNIEQADRIIEILNKSTKSPNGNGNIDIENNIIDYIGQYILFSKNYLYQALPNIEQKSGRHIMHFGKMNGSKSTLILGRTGDSLSSLITLDLDTSNNSFGEKITDKALSNKLQALVRHISPNKDLGGARNISVTKANVNKEAYFNNNKIPKIEINADSGTVIEKVEEEKTYQDFYEEKIIKTTRLHRTIPQDGSNEEKIISSSHPIIEFSLKNKGTVEERVKNTNPLPESKNPIEPEKIQTDPVSNPVVDNKPKTENPLEEEVSEKKEGKKENKEEVKKPVKNLSESVTEDLKKVENIEGGKELFEGFKILTKQTLSSFAPKIFNKVQNNLLNATTNFLIDKLNLPQQYNFQYALLGQIFRNIVDEIKTSSETNLNNLKDKFNEIISNTFDTNIETKIEKEQKRLEFLEKNDMKDTDLYKEVQHRLSVFNTLKENKNKLISKNSPIIRTLSKLTDVNLSGEIEQEKDLKETQESEDDLDDGLENLEEGEEAYDRNAFEKSLIKSISNKLKLFLGDIKKVDHNNNIVTNEFEMEEYYTPEEALGYLVGQLSVVPSNWEIFMNTLKSKQHSPLMRSLYEKLKDTPEHLRNEILTKLMGRRLNMYTVTKSGVYNENHFTPERDLRNKWITQFGLNVGEGNVLVQNEDNIVYDSALLQTISNKLAFYANAFKKGGSLYEVFSNIRKETKKNGEDFDVQKVQNQLLLEHYGKELRDIFDSLGIYLTQEAFDTYIKMRGLSSISSASGDIQGILRVFMQRTATNTPYSRKGFFKGIDNYLSNLINFEIAVTGFSLNGTFRSGGKTVNMLIMPNLVGTLTDYLKDPKSEYSQKLRKTVFAKNSALLDLLEENEDLRKSFASDFMSLKADGDNKKKSNTKINEISDKSKAYVRGQHFSETVQNNIQSDKHPNLLFRVARMIGMTVSDKSNTPLYTTAVLDLRYHKDEKASNFKVKFDEGEHGYFNSIDLNDNVLDFLAKEIWEAEFDRIVDSIKRGSTNISGYDDASKMFLSISSFNNMKVKVKDKEVTILEYIHESLSSKKLKGKKADEHIDKIKNLFRDQAKEVINKYVKEEVEKEKKYLFPEDIGEGIYAYSTKEPFNSKFLRSKVNNSTGMSKEFKTELAIYDLVVNTLWNNSNQSKIFSGDPALYAPKVEKFLDKETNDKLKKEGVSLEQKAKIISEYFAKNPVALQNYNKAVGESQLKRMAMQIAPGNVIANSFGDKYMQIFVNDVVKPSADLPFYIEMLYGEKPSKEVLEHIENLQNAYNEIDKISENRKDNPNFESLIKEQNKIISDLSKKITKEYPLIDSFIAIEGTDAQEYTTWKEHLDIIRRQGTLTKDQLDAIEDIYNKLSENEDYELSLDELKLVMQPIKPVYAGPTGSLNGDSINEEKGINRVVYVKSSSFPLLPQLTKGTTLDNVRKKIEEVQKLTGKNVRLSYQTANKVGSIKTDLTMNDLYHGGIAEMMQQGGKLHSSMLEMDRMNFKIQQNVPYKTAKNVANLSEDQITMSSQMWKILMSNSINDLKDENGNFIKAFNSKHLDKSLIKEFNSKLSKEDEHLKIKHGELITGPQLDAVKTYFENKLFDSKYNQLLEELGFDPKDIDYDGNLNKVMQKLSQIIQREISERSYPESLKDIVELKKDRYGNLIFKNPIWLNENHNRIDNILQAIVNNRIMHLKLPGNGLVSTSSEGFTAKKSLDQLDLKTTRGIIWIGERRENNLRATRLENGELKESEVLVQSKFRKTVKNEKTGKWETKLIDLREKDSEGNYIYLDDSKGYYTLKEDMIDPELLTNFSFRIPVSSHQSGAIIKIAGFLPEQSADMIVLPREHTTLLGEDYDIDKRYVYRNNYIVDDNGKVRKLKGSNNTKDIYTSQKVDQSDNEDVVKEDFKDEVNDLILENIIMDVYKTVYMSNNPQVQSKINKVLSMDVAKETIKEIRKATSKNSDNEAFSIYSNSYQEEQMNSGSAGKIGTALHSLAIVFQSQLERAGGVNVGSRVTFGKVTSDGKIGIKKALVAKGDKITPRLVSDIHSENQNSAVDNIKAQIMYYRNENRHTMNALVQMTLRGFDRITVNDNGENKVLQLPSLLLAQPIFKEYSQYLEEGKTIKEFEKDYFGDSNLSVFRKKWNAIKNNDMDANFSNLTGENLLNNLKNKNKNLDLDLEAYLLFKLMDKEAKDLSTIKGLTNKNNLPKSQLETQALKDNLLSLIKNISIDDIMDLKKGINNNVLKLLIDFDKSPLIKSLKENPKLYFDDNGKMIFQVTEAMFNSKYLVPSSPEGNRILKALTVSSKISDLVYRDSSRNNILETINSIYDKIQELKNEEVVFKTKDEIFREKSEILSSLRDYLLSNSATGLFTDTVENERKRLFFNTHNNKSLANYVYELSQHPDYKILFEKNRFLKGLNFEGVQPIKEPVLSKDKVHSTKETIEAYNKVNSQPSVLLYNKFQGNQETQYEEFLHLASNDVITLPEFNGKKMTPRELAKELAIYSMLASQDNSTSGFRHLINNTFLDIAGFGKTFSILDFSKVGSTIEKDNSLHIGLQASETMYDDFIIQYLSQNNNGIPETDTFTVANIFGGYVINKNNASNLENIDLTNFIEHAIGDIYNKKRLDKIYINKTLIPKAIEYINSGLESHALPNIIRVGSFLLQREDKTSYRIIPIKEKVKGYHEYNSSILPTYKDLVEANINRIQSNLEIDPDSHWDKKDLEIMESEKEFLDNEVEEDVKEDIKEDVSKTIVEKEIENKTPLQLINEVINSIPKDDIRHSILNQILNIDLSDISIKIVDNYNGDTTFPAAFNHDSNTIYFNKNMPEQEWSDRKNNLIIEEMVHAVTVHALNKYIENPINLTFKEGVEVPNSVKNLIDLLKLARTNQGNKEISDNYDYYTQDIYEFVAGVFVDENFRHALDNSKDSSGKSLFTKFKEILAKLLREFSGSSFSSATRNEVITFLNQNLKAQEKSSVVDNVKFSNVFEEVDRLAKELETVFSFDTSSMYPNQALKLQEAIDNLEESDVNKIFSDLISNKSSKSEIMDIIDNTIIKSIKNEFVGKIAFSISTNNKNTFENLFAKRLTNEFNLMNPSNSEYTFKTVKIGDKTVVFIEKINEQGIYNNPIVDMLNIINNNYGLDEKQIVSLLDQEGIIDKICD